MLKLGVKSLVDKLVKTLAEHIGAPDSLRILLKFLKHVFDKILGLLLCTDNWIDLGFNVRSYHVYRLCRCAKSYAISAGLLDYFGLCKVQFAHVGHNNAVAALLGLIKCRFYSVVSFLHFRQGFKQRNKLILAADVKAGKLTYNVVVEAVLHCNRQCRTSGAEIYLVDCCTLYIFVVGKGVKRALDVTCLVNFSCAFLYIIKQGYLNSVCVLKRSCPLGHGHSDFCNRELV